MNKLKLKYCYFTIKRLLRRDFRGKMSREKLFVDSGMRSLRSLFVKRDVKLLLRFCTSLKPEPIIERPLSQCYTQSRPDNKLYYYYYSTRKSSRASFINRAKYIAELIPFEWLQLSNNSFHRQFISMLPPHL